MTQVTQISPTQKRKDRFSVYLEGKFAFAVSEFILNKYKLKERTELSSIQVEEIVFEENLEYLKSKALDLLSRRPRSEKEVVDKLKLTLSKRISSPPRHPEGGSFRPKDLERHLVEKVVSFLKKYNYLDDKEFAHWLVEQRLRQNKGPLFIKQDLFKKGIDKELAKEVLESLDIKKALDKAYIKALSKYSKESDVYKRKQKIYSYLLRQGFLHEEVQDLLFK